MSFSNITQEDLVNRGVTGLPDTPNLSTADMQRKFDELALDVVIPKFNKLLEDLASATAAANIGANAPEGMTGETVQALLDSFYTVVQACEGAKHAHENLDVLDSMTTEIYANIDHIIAILGDITNITDTVTGSSTEIPTGKAIAEYIQVLGGGDMLKSIYDPDGDGVVVAAEEAGNAERLGGQLPNYYQSVTADDLETAAKTIVGAINELNGKSVDTYTTMEQVEAATDPTIPVGAGAIKELNDSLGGLKFGTDGEGNYGYFGDDDVLVPFSSGQLEYVLTLYGSGVTSVSITPTFNAKVIYYFAFTGGAYSHVFKYDVKTNSLYYDGNIIDSSLMSIVDNTYTLNLTTTLGDTWDGAFIAI